MSTEKSNQLQQQIISFGEKAKVCRTDNQKVKFFDSSKEAFFIHSIKSNSSVTKNIPKDLDDAFYVYANMKKMNEKELHGLQSLRWTEYPKNLKIFLFDFCILNSETYSKYFNN